MKLRNVKIEFSKWARHRQALPPENERLKELVLAVLPRNSEQSVVKRPIRLFWAGAGALCAILLTVSVSRYIMGSLSYASDPGPVYNGARSAGYGSKMETQIKTSPASTGGNFGLAEIESNLQLGNSGPGLMDTIINNFAKPKIDDTREFLKTGYNTNIKTRQVSKVATRIQTMVRGYGGRIDNASVNKESASISFVIPKSSLEFFKAELGDFIPERFIEENLQMQNLLPQKQRIETDTGATEERLGNLQESRKTLVASHDSKAAAIQKQINNYTYRIAVLNKEMTTSTERLAQIEKDRAWLNSQLRYQRQQLSNENEQFQSSLQNIDYNIGEANRQRDNLLVQDKNLLNDVETVEGNISLERINIFELLDLYVPIYWLMGGAALLLIGYLLFGRRVKFDEGLLD